MIKVTRLNHTPLILNSDLIEHIDVTPDTVITLTSGQKFMVQESIPEIIEKVIVFRKSLFSKELFCPVAVPGTDRSCRDRAAETSAHGR
jgi:flagellar protein FlbD